MLTIKEIKQYFNNFGLCFLFILKGLPTSVQGGRHFTVFISTVTEKIIIS